MAAKTHLAFSSNTYNWANYNPPPNFSTLSDDLILKIFNCLDFKSHLYAKQTCRDWNRLVADPATVYGAYLKKCDSIANLLRLNPRFSAWDSMPRHWGLYTKNALQFSSVDQDIISFYPSFLSQSSKFFSFKGSLSQFPDDCVLLARHKDTYFLTPQSKTQLRLAFPTALEPLASHKIIAVNANDSTKTREFSLLGDLAPTPENLELRQIETCFPISETALAVLTNDGTISFWDISQQDAVCYKELQLENRVYKEYIHQLSNYLLTDTKIVNLSVAEFADHGFAFKTLPYQNETIKAFGSSFCNYDKKTYNLRHFIINKMGVLENDWSFSFTPILEGLEKSHGPILSSCIRDMNEEFIVLSCSQNQAIHLLILSTKGELVHSITQELVDAELENALYAYPIFAHLSGNILIYKDPENPLVYFWHLHAKKCLQKFDWTKTVYDLPMLVGNGVVQDIRFERGRLTVLLSSGHVPHSNRPVGYRLVQFDPQRPTQSGIWGMLNTIYETIKGIYYAFPGKLNS